MSAPSLLPKRSRGRQSFQAEAEYRKQVAAFCTLIRKIQSKMDFAVGSRGWCYILERHGLRKGDFDAAQRLINECRRTGALPLSICAEDSSRETIGIEQLDTDDISDQVDSWVDYLRNRAHEQYTPVSFWDELDTYVEVGTEKLDLRNLFEPVCEELQVPLTNFKGWSDLNSRAAMMRRFKMHETQGRRCVLLLCGDHDPGGLHITQKMRQNLEDLSGAVGWSPDNLVIHPIWPQRQVHRPAWADLDRQSGDVERRTAGRSRSRRPRQALRTGIHRRIWGPQVRSQRPRC
jgi:hypothetical protein